MVFPAPGGAALPRINADAISQWLSESDLIFLGRLDSLKSSEDRAHVGLDAVRLHCSLLRTYLGSLEGEHVDFDAETGFARQRLRPGTRLLVSGRGAAPPLLYGIHVLGGADSVLTCFRNNCDTEDLRHDRRALRLKDLSLDEIGAGAFERLLHRADGLAIVDVKWDGKPHDWRREAECVRAFWIVSGSGALPARLRFEVRREGGFGLLPARLVVAVPAGHGGGTLRIRARPSVLRVDHGCVAAIGIAADSLAAHVARDSRGRLRMTSPEWGPR